MSRNSHQFHQKVISVIQLLLLLVFAPFQFLFQCLSSMLMLRRILGKLLFKVVFLVYLLVTDVLLLLTYGFFIIHGLHCCLKYPCYVLYHQIAYFPTCYFRNTFATKRFTLMDPLYQVLKVPSHVNSCMLREEPFNLLVFPQNGIKRVIYFMICIF